MDLLTGRLLVATPVLTDGNFNRAVVVILDHDDDGTLGVIINRSTDRPVGSVLPVWHSHTSQPEVIFEGGPVAQDSAVALAEVTTDEEPLGWRRVAGHLGLVDLDTPPEVLAEELRGLRIFAGYAGWSPGQLDDEIAEGAWWVVPAEPGDVFSPTPELLWRAVLRRQPGSLRLVSTYPEDPTLN